MYLEFKNFKKINLLLKVSSEYTSSYFIVISTGNKKKNRKWTNGVETLHIHNLTIYLAYDDILNMTLYPASDTIY